MHMKTVFKWVYLAGMLVAIVAGLLKYSAEWLTAVLILAGILVGVFFFDSDDVVHFGLRFLALAVAASTVSGLYKIGPYLTDIFNAIAGYLGPIVLTLLVVWFLKKYFLAKA
jgi:hypothetical protein